MGDFVQKSPTSHLFHKDSYKLPWVLYCWTGGAGEIANLHLLNFVNAGYFCQGRSKKLKYCFSPQWGFFPGKHFDGYYGQLNFLGVLPCLVPVSAVSRDKDINDVLLTTCTMIWEQCEGKINLMFSFWDLLHRGAFTESSQKIWSQRQALVQDTCYWGFHSPFTFETVKTSRKLSYLWVWQIANVNIRTQNMVKISKEQLSPFLRIWRQFSGYCVMMALSSHLTATVCGKHESLMKSFIHELTKL